MKTKIARVVLSFSIALLLIFSFASSFAKSSLTNANGVDNTPSFLSPGAVVSSNSLTQVTKGEYQYFFKKDAANSYQFLYMQRVPSNASLENATNEEVVKIDINNQSFLFSTNTGRPTLLASR
jgi:hypothetical protein